MKRRISLAIGVIVTAASVTTAGAAVKEVVSWRGEGLAPWNRVSQARDLACGASGVSFITDGPDSQLYCEKCDFVASASQSLRFRVRSTAGGKTEVFWAAADDPNLSQRKSCSFEMIGDGAWHDYELRPFWPSGKRIVKLRFDPPQTAPRGTRVDVSEIAILENPDGAGPIDTAKFPGVMFRYTTSEKRYVTMAWTTDASETMCRHEFRTVPDGKEHVYWFDLSLGVNGGIGNWYKKDWTGTASWFGVMDMRRGKALDVKDLRFVSEPPHLPADVEVESALPSDGIVRVGYRSGIELVLRNLGTVPARKVVFELDSVSGGLAFADKTYPLDRIPASIGYDSPGGRLPNELVTTVPFDAKHAGKHVVRGRVSYESEGSEPVTRHVPVECTVEVLPSLGLPKADYVPEPKPIATRCEIGALSFPGWRKHAWDRIRNFTPERKPLLGWYDEGSPEVVDWQIKWLVENGISYLIVDWYPRKENVTGRFYLSIDHWIEAFRKARHRRFLKWAVLWENTMKGHDLAFVEKTAKYLVDEYFPMPEYYRIDDRPVVYVWNRTQLDRDLAASGGCRKALEIIEKAAKAKGYKGVWFIAHRSPALSREEIASLRATGFDMTAIYRYRGEASPGVSSLVEGRRPFDEVAKTSLYHWRELHKIGLLPFLPSLTTGWDDRPWNADHGFEIYGRTVAAFEAICRDAALFADESGVRNMLVGPINEWGEGSYAEPNAEYGFGMYEAIRNTFGIKPAEGWPVNFTPKDVGMTLQPCKPVLKVADKMWTVKPGDVKVGGAIGTKMDSFFKARIVSKEGREKIFDEAREAFKTRDDDSCGFAGLWRGEFWGKEMLSSACVAKHLGKPELNDALRTECHRLMAFQDADGYLGSYSNKEFLVCTDLEACRKKFGWFPNWNIWNRKYTIWGMYEAYRTTGDKAILDSVVRQMDQLIAMMHRLKLRLHDVGTLGMNGLPPMSILKPLLLLYRETGKAEYLDFARETVCDWDRDDGAGPNFLRNFTNGKPLWQWYPSPERWAKSYEMMSCLEGLLEYYRLTGERLAFDAVRAIRDNIARNETNPIGGVGFCDKFGGAAERANAVSEVCDSIHWMRLNKELFLLTGDVKYIDAIAFTYYNAFLAGIYRNGEYGAFAVRAEMRHATQYQCGYKYNHCCVNNVPRGLVDVAELAVTYNVDHTLFVNFYHDATVEVDGVTFVFAGGYPARDRVKVTTRSPIPRYVKFRMPGFGQRPTKYVGRQIKAGEETFELRFDMTPRVVERPVGIDEIAPPYPARNWYTMRYATTSKPTPETQDIWDAYRSSRAATVMYGPLVLAKAKRLGLKGNEIFAAETINGKGYSVRLKTLPAKETLGAWEVELYKPGEKTIRTKACDYQSAADEALPPGAAVFSTWF